jgi:hypothetical protein
MKSMALLLFLVTGICSGLSALYVWGGYASGLPAKGWSSPLVFALLAASIGMVFAGAAIFRSLRVSRVVALCSGGVLEAFLIAGVLTGVGSLLSAERDSSLNWGPFAGLIILPFLLTTASLVVAWRIR